ncbi:PfkB family carbohydrate kinase [Nocardia farcinica]|uniref:Putative sugar kinase n=1 Tax=Nocardia farcinica (strain IFM 10152) TaxID=247156 RepID=Q5YX52_NOCFA|nr:PfkB family carbohydrate kinase [Nocardia farcinica]BAD57239.1 putative sugar kinase [Nocardia farcinica IFM 10152]
MAATGPLVVVGDILLDVDVEGTADRRSPDAPVPVVDVTGRTYRPGGAGLAARLAADDSAEVVLIAGFAPDEASERLRALLGPRVRVVALPLHGATVRKERVLATGPWARPGARGDQRGRRALITRIDYGDGRIGTDPLPDDALDALAAARGVLVSDYGRGASAHPHLRAVLKNAAAPVVWDPHPRGAAPVPGMTLVTPNRGEALDQLAAPPTTDTDLCALTRRWGVRAVAVTLGSEGALVCGRHECTRIALPAERRGPDGCDTCGAGDRFATAATAALADGHDLEQAVRRAVYAAADFVARGAAGTVSVTESAVPEPVAVTSWA